MATTTRVCLLVQSMDDYIVYMFICPVNHVVLSNTRKKLLA